MSTILEVRKGQNNIETSGPKCNRCAYDVTWNPKQSQEDFGKNRPYEKGLRDAHECPKNDNGEIIVREGYEIQQTSDGKNKVVCLIAHSQQTKLPSHADNNEMMKEEIQDLRNKIENMTMEMSKLIIKQNQDISELKAIVQNYTQYNPIAPMFNSLIDKLMTYLPEQELKPKTAAADEL